MVLHLLDTSVCVSLHRGRLPLTALPPANACVVSVITAAEVGIRRSTRPHEQRRAVSSLLECFEVLPFGREAVTYYGAIRTHLEKNGTPIGPLDCLIAAHARSVERRR